MISYYCKRFGGLGEVPREEDNMPIVEPYYGNPRFRTIVTYQKELSDDEIKSYELVKVTKDNFTKDNR